jgi:hypothetical protein
MWSIHASSADSRSHIRLYVLRGSVQCVTRFTYYDKLLLVFIVPLAVLFVLILVPYVILAIKNRFDYSDSAADRIVRKHDRHKIVRLVVFALFLSTCFVAASHLLRT